MTKNEKRFLSRHVCAWCQHRLDVDGCSALYEKCTPEQQAKRREKCLEAYKPRATASAQGRAA